jgi:hypothetical protein
MNILFRYLMSLMAHVAWQRMGRGGPVPPLRIPGKRTVQLPVISSWQIMATMWLMKKMWGRYGQDVKSRLSDAPHPWVRQAGSLLPDTATSAPAGSPTAATPAPPIPAPTVNRDTQPLPSPQKLRSGSVLSSLHNPLQKGATS